jgi:hypothetical protein
MPGSGCNRSVAGKVCPGVPDISRFLGIVVRMYYRDHAPPHFHACYGEYEVVVGLDDGVVGGRFPRRALQHVLEWYHLHRAELEEDWELARCEQPLKPIPPLE